VAQARASGGGHHLDMAGHEKRTERAERNARGIVSELGRELRLARLNHDLSQRTAARAAGFSHSKWGRIERGVATDISILDMARALAVVGFDLHTRAYPAGHPLRDHAHARLLEELRRHLGSLAQWRTEVPLPNRGDRRAWDAVITLAGVRIGVEAETRARDAQELDRRLNTKRRDGGVDHVILLLSDTRHNRTFLRAVGPGFLALFDVDGRTALRRLEQSQDPGGSSIILLPTGRSRGGETPGATR
jgi:transcriptional regulator with XRE-family HTH domain